MMYTMKKPYKVAILLNANKAYDRGLIYGIGEYIQSSLCYWDIYIEEDFYSNNKNINLGKYDGIIADYDNPNTDKHLSSIDSFIVGIGGSYEDKNNYPNIPYIATDNYKLIECAYEHLRNKGLLNFGYYGFPKGDYWRWSIEREQAFMKIIKKDGVTGTVYRGLEPYEHNWDDSAKGIECWLKTMLIPTGIIVATDARARQLLQIIDTLNIPIPEHISVIGIDNEEVTRYLSRIPLSSVEQGVRTMGYNAAKMLHSLLNGNHLEHDHIIIPPKNVHGRLSSNYRSIKDPDVIKAQHYIRLNAFKGLKVAQVLEYLNISRSNLDNKFKREVGYSIHHEIHINKINKSLDLLKNTKLSISEISDASGYPTVQYMYAVFKKEFNKTPNEFRFYSD
jgi:LacI family transcriptional regulator